MSTIVLALRYMSRRKLRTALTTLAIVFGVMVIYGANTAIPSVRHAFEQLNAAPGSVDLRVTAVGGISFVPDAALALLRSLPEVSAVGGSLQRTLMLPIPGTEGVQVDIIGVDLSVEVANYPLSEGRFLQPGDSGQVVLPASVAALAPELSVGGRIPLLTAGGLRWFTIVGLLADIPGGLRLYVSLEDAQAMFNQSGQVNALEINFAAGADENAATERVLAALGSGYREGSRIEASTPVLDEAFTTAFFNLFGVMALFVGGFLVFNTLRTTVVERRYDLSVLRMIGGESAQVIRLVLAESLLQGIAGTALGIAAGWWFAGFAIVTTFNIYSYVLGNMTVTLYFQPLALVLALLLGIGITLVAAYLPARAAGKVSPLEALRPQTVIHARRTARGMQFAGIAALMAALALLVTGALTAGGLLCLLAAALLTPSLIEPALYAFRPLVHLLFARESDLAHGNTLRQPGRTVATVDMLMVAIAVFVASAALAVSLSSFVISSFENNYRSDLLLMPRYTIGGEITSRAMGADASLSERLLALSEVVAVTSWRIGDTLLDDGTPLRLIGIDPQLAPQLHPLETDSPDVYPRLASGRTALMTSRMAREFGYRAGDILELQTPDGSTQRYEIIGTADDIGVGNVYGLFISQENLAFDFGRTEDVLLSIDVTALESGYAAVEQLLVDYPQFILYDIRTQLLDRYYGAALGTQALLFGMASIVIIPSALGLLNTLAISALERTREIGILRAIGSDRDQIARMMIAEALLLGLCGIAIGIVTGIALSFGFVHQLAILAPGSMGYSFPFGGILAALVLGILLALLASALPARNASHTDIVQALRYE